MPLYELGCTADHQSYAASGEYSNYVHQRYNLMVYHRLSRSLSPFSSVEHGRGKRQCLHPAHVSVGILDEIRDQSCHRC